MSEECTKIEGVSIVIPAYNEEGAVGQSVQGVLDVMNQSGLEYELIVVDDGSSDRTSEILKGMNGVVLMSIPENRGYGASLKTGIRQSKYDLIVITDADGTYPSERIPHLVAECKHYDMVVGARVGKNVQIPTIRKPAKWVLGKIASYLAGRRIPHNCRLTRCSQGVAPGLTCSGPFRARIDVRVPLACQCSF